MKNLQKRLETAKRRLDQAHSKRRNAFNMGDENRAIAQTNLWYKRIYFLELEIELAK